MAGNIVPAEITCALLHRAMDDSGSGNFLIDGFPRNEDNMTTWDREMGERARVLFVLFFDCDEATCIERCLGRGAGRSDDNLESLKKRFVTYVGHTMPIVEHYRGLGLVRDVDARGTPDEVFEAVREIFDAQKEL